MDGGVRGRPGPTYRAAANLGVRARFWKAGVVFAGDRGRAVAWGRRSWRVGQECQRERALAEVVEAGADVWARGASGEEASAWADVALG